MEVTPQIRRYIREEIKRHLNIILTVTSDKSKSIDTTTLKAIYNEQEETGAEQIAVPVAHPFGFVSRAPNQIFTVIGRVGEYQGSMMVLGYRDEKRPECDVGDTVIYSSNPQQGTVRRKIKISSDIKIGSDSSGEPLVLGNVMKSFITDLITTLQTTPIGLTTSPGNPIAPNPSFVTATNALKAQYVTTPATNIVSTISFTERGAPVS